MQRWGTSASTRDLATLERLRQSVGLDRLEPILRCRLGFPFRGGAGHLLAHLILRDGDRELALGRLDQGDERVHAGVTDDGEQCEQGGKTDQARHAPNSRAVWTHLELMRAALSAAEGRLVIFLRTVITNLHRAHPPQAERES